MGVRSGNNSRAVAIMNYEVERFKAARGILEIRMLIAGINLTDKISTELKGQLITAYL